MTARTVIAALVIAAGAACDRAAKVPSGSPARMEAARGAPEAAHAQLRGLGYVQDKAAPTAAGQPNATPAPPPAATPGVAAASRKLIRTAQLALEVPSYDRAAEAVAKAAEEGGGYVAESKAARVDAGRHGGSLTVRVPAERFASVLATLKGLGTVTSETVSTQDVTKAYTDLETRLRVKRDAAGRVQAILNTRTARLSDVLEAERELARLTEEIEQMEGERRFYDQQIALSTISVEISEPSPLLGSGPFHHIREALHQSLEVLVVSVAGLIYALVFLAPWLAVAWVVWRIVRWVRRRRAPSAAPPAG
jgi:Domain of unknown function (DUF4349)